MAGLLPSFQSGSNLYIYIGNVLVAYGTNLSLSQDMTNVGVGGIGSMSYDAIEPTAYAARGSFSITRYSKLASDAIQAKTAAPAASVPGRFGVTPDVDGNSMLHPAQFNPINLIISKTFDIKVFERNAQTGVSGNLVYTAKDCRMTNYSMGFTPGSLVTENISFRCLRIDTSTPV
jgi:hypothetical protein